MIFEFRQIFFEIVTQLSITISYTRYLYNILSVLSPWSPLSRLSLLGPPTRDSMD